MQPHMAKKTKNKPQLNPDEYVYDLVAVSNHYGNMMGGHYTAFCRSPVDGKWREFNDTKVTLLDHTVVTKEAYILFYQRRSLSKDINQKLFTGDHWVFSLPLSPPNRVEEPIVSDNLSLQDDPPPPLVSPRHRRSRSRSSSPTPRKLANGTSEAPNPVGSPTSSRTSRPLQRQSSSPGQQVRRGKSAGALLSSSRLTPRYAMDDNDITSLKSNRSKDKRGKEDYYLSSAPKDSVSTHLDEDATVTNVKINGFDQNNSRTKELTGIAVSSNYSKRPLTTIIRHSRETELAKDVGKEKAGVHFLSHTIGKSNALHSISNSANGTRASKELKPLRTQTYSPNVELQSDSKYPPSTHLPSLSSSNMDKHQNRSADDSRSSLDFTSVLQVNLEDIENRPSSSRSVPSPHIVTSSGDARKKLAELKKDSSSHPMQNEPLMFLPSTRTNTSSSRNTQHSRYQSQTSYEIAKGNPIKMNFDSPRTTLKLDSDISKQYDRDLHNLLTSEPYQKEVYRHPKVRDPFKYSPLDEETEDYRLYDDESTVIESSLLRRNAKHEQLFQELAYKHFGNLDDKDILERSLGKLKT